MPDNNQSFLFIPDISGFTHFVSTTEIDHSQHIIAELLELLIDTDDLDLVVSEIEGDAVLFYKYKSAPSPSELMAQAERMFLAFHSHLRQYDLNRICDCGACSSAASLTLKIVAHKGEFGIIKVKDFQKPYGSDVILIHRLLKNDIPDDEYLLMTDVLLEDVQDGELSSRFPWAKFHAGSATYSSIGEVPFVFVPLSPLHKDVPSFNPLPTFERTEDPLVEELYIESPLMDVFQIVSDLNRRHEWNQEVKALHFDPYKVNRAGTPHTCVLPVGNLQFETLNAEQEADRRYYIERVKNSPFVKEQVILFELVREGEGTRLRHEIHMHNNKLLGMLFGKRLGKAFQKTMKTHLQRIKEIAESKTATLSLA